MFIMTLPCDGTSNNPAICSNVLFPAPELPIKATNSPLKISKLTSEKTQFCCSE
ncbi:hypothetical protein APHMUC_1289 [Anaplasma phagocytophilum str. ApMUC09]|uniref:Uncharacterized protein n=1 Tax=Anaplasma phagocytophilum str. ApMUC09 TaxID=1359152 RepID=A0A0F3NBX6_ANAPH|nr:hypothetical protein APHMUC_1289 [Anaplasma phagocytophilum str. ApMUC09]